MITNLKKRKSGLLFLEDYFLANCPETEYKGDIVRSGKARSFSDLLILYCTYYKEGNPKKLAKILFKLQEKIGIKSLYCKSIKKVVFMYKSHPYQRDLFTAPNTNENTNTSKKGVDGWSFDDLCRLKNT